MPVHVAHVIGYYRDPVRMDEDPLRSVAGFGTYQSDLVADSGGTCCHTGSTRKACFLGQIVGDFARVESLRRRKPSDSTGREVAVHPLPHLVPYGSGRSIAKDPDQSLTRADSETAGLRTLRVEVANFPPVVAGGHVSSSIHRSPN